MTVESLALTKSQELLQDNIFKKRRESHGVF